MIFEFQKIGKNRGKLNYTLEINFLKNAIKIISGSSQMFSLILIFVFFKKTLILTYIISSLVH